MRRISIGWLFVLCALILAPLLVLNCGDSSGDDDDDDAVGDDDSSDDDDAVDDDDDANVDDDDDFNPPSCTKLEGQLNGVWDIFRPTKEKAGATVTLTHAVGTCNVHWSAGPAFHGELDGEIKGNQLFVDWEDPDSDDVIHIEGNIVHTNDNITGTDFGLLNNTPFGGIYEMNKQVAK
jgi:hypothetical protein